MNDTYIHNIDRIEFIVTYSCTGHCAHCSQGDCAHPGGHLSPSQAASVVEEICAFNSVQSVMTFGGEPLLFPDTVCAVHSAAARSNVPVRQLITNGFFSRDAGEIRRVAIMLADAGVNDLLLSADAFHQATIPVEPVQLFAKAAAALMPVRLSPSWVVNRGFDCEYNRQTAAIVESFRSIGIEPNEGNDIFLAGRAEANLAQFYPDCRADLTERCGSQPYTMPLNYISELSIDPNGDVTFCCFKVGNIHETPLRELLESYDPYSIPAISALMTGGVPALLEYAHSLGRPELDRINADDFRSACSVCRAIAAELNKNKG